jgi:hypothetical protein
MAPRGAARRLQILLTPPGFQRGTSQQRDRDHAGNQQVDRVTTADLPRLTGTSTPATVDQTAAADPAQQRADRSRLFVVAPSTAPSSPVN